MDDTVEVVVVFLTAGPLVGVLILGLAAAVLRYRPSSTASSSNRSA
jgi:hypothetical protein